MEEVEEDVEEEEGADEEDFTIVDGMSWAGGGGSDAIPLQGSHKETLSCVGGKLAWIRSNRLPSVELWVA